MVTQLDIQNAIQRIKRNREKQLSDSVINASIKNEIERLVPILSDKMGIKFQLKFSEGSRSTANNSTSTITIGLKGLRYLRIENYDHPDLKLLVHECLHIQGMKHNPANRKKGYYSNLRDDTYTEQYINEYLNGGNL